MKRVCLAALFLMISAPLSAQENGDDSPWKSGFYIGAGAGGLRIDTKLSSIDAQRADVNVTPSDSISSDNFKKTSISSKFMAGFRLGYVGLEASYFEAYDVKQTYCFTDIDGDCVETAVIKACGSDGSCSARMPTCE